MDERMDGRTDVCIRASIQPFIIPSIRPSSQSIHIHTTYIECCVTKCPILQAFGARLGRLSGEAPPTD